MTDYEKAQGRKCGRISFSRLSEPGEVVGERIRIHDLQGSSGRCGYQDYRVKITYSDDADFVVQNIEILERVTK